MNNSDAERYWKERVESGDLDGNKEVTDLGPKELPIKLTLSGEDLIVIEEALHRKFLQIKRGRFDVIRVVLRIRRAMRKAMM